VPNDELHGVGEGDTIQVDLRNPKAFLVAGETPARDEIISTA
jgi:hypothetical protein